MKKNKLFVLIFVFVMFFGFNLDVVKAENKMCSKDVSVKKAYSCDYSGSNNGILGEASTSFSFMLVEDDNNNICSIIDNANFMYKDHVAVFGLSDDSFDASNANIRRFVKFDLAYNSIMDEMKKGSCPVLNAKITANFTAWGLGSYTGIKEFKLKGSHDFICSWSSSTVCINDINGTNNHEVSKGDAEKAIDNALLSDEQIKKYIKKWAEKTTGFDQNIDGDLSDCRSILTDDMIDIINRALLIIDVVGVILVIVLSMVDFVTTIASSDDDGIMKSFKKVKTRLIAVVLLLFTPLLLSWVINYLNDNIYFDGMDKMHIGNVSECLNK